MRFEDVQRKIRSVVDPTRGASKRQQDLADIARLIERCPHLRGHLPAAGIDRLR